MATTTTNYGWDIPQSTDLVKDGATAIATLGQDIDTAFVDLKGGTTGQILAKQSNTDLDFTWASAGIPATIIDAKGDLIAGSAADTAARLGVGSDGQVLTADSTASTGLKWAASSSALTLITTNSFASASTVNVDSIFTSTYTNYKIIIDVTGSSGSNIMLFRLRSGGSTDTATTYNYYSYDIVVGGVGNSSAASQNNMFGFPTNSRISSVSFDLLNPQVTEYTKALPHAIYDDGSNPGMRLFSAVKNNTTQYDGFALVATSGSFTGKYWVYGYQKA